jgi:hypothetical protein
MVGKDANKRNNQKNIKVDRKMAVDILLAYSKEEWEQRRQSENQRSTMTNFILTISSAAMLLIINKGFGFEALPFAILLIPLGLFGAITAEKLYERGEYHIAHTREWRDKINNLYPEAELLRLREKATDKHKSVFGKAILERIRLHKLWVYFNVAITLIGIGLAVFIVIR